MSQTAGAALDAQNLGKLIGGHTHNLEEITFNVVGINQDFALSSGNLNFNTALPNGSNLGTYGLVQDSALPANGDLSTEWYFDVRAFGTPTNEVVAGAPTWLGSNLVQREYQRLVEDDLARLVGLQGLAAGQLLVAGCKRQRRWHPVASGSPARGPRPDCRGRAACLHRHGDHDLLPGSAVFPTDGPSIAEYDDPFGFLRSGSRPQASATTSSPSSRTRSSRPPAASPTSTTTASSGIQVLSRWVSPRVMGKGNILNLPYEARDRRYYFSVVPESR